MENTQTLKVSVLDIRPGDLFRGLKVSSVDHLSKYVNVWLNDNSDICRLTRESIVTVQR